MNAPEPGNDSFKSRWQEMQGAVIEAYRLREQDAMQVLSLLTEQMDQFLLELIQHSGRNLTHSIQDALREDIAIIAVGGYGRGEMFPHSDVDILITYEGSGNPMLQNFTSEFVRQCWDAGLKLGHAARSVSDTVSLGREEAQVATSLVETRLLWGNASIHDQLRRRFESWISKSRRHFIDACELSRKKEIQETASAVFSLEPDVKRSPGGLRDLQLITWIGFARHEVTDFESLANINALQPEIAEGLNKARAFLSDIRMNLHVHSTRAQDVLTRQEQLRLTDQTGISDHAGQRAVERFMQNYFRNAELVSRTARRFVELNRPSTFQERVSARVYRRTVDDKYVIVAGRLNVVSYDVSSVTQSLERILETFQVAMNYKVRVSTRLIEAIKLRVPRLPRQISAEAAQQFCEILRSFGQISQTVRDLYECGVLEILIPHFSHARGLLQFNLYHAYTVDEHTFRTLEALDQIAREKDWPVSLLGELKCPFQLPLALLLHDLGKGYEEDHCVLGAEYAQELGDKWFLSREQINQLELLIREHLSMSMLAFRRDTSDPEVVAAFSGTVRDTDTLKKLYLLTICDIQAVAPGLWNDWKARLLRELYERTLLSLEGKYERPHVDERLEAIRSEAIRLIEKKRTAPDELQLAIQDLQSMPEHYLLSASPQGIAEDMQVAMELQEGSIEIVNRYDPEKQTLELTIITRQHGLSRCFHRLAGVLTALNFSILAADIYTGDSGLICDRFLVTDITSPQQPGERRLATIRERLREAVSRPVSFEKLFQKHRRYQYSGKQGPISDQESQVVIDNETSSSATIIDVFAHDRTGLLFTLSKAIYDLDLSVTLARITTHVDQVVDVFYVTNLEGEKIEDEYALKAIRDRLQRVLEEFERYGHRLFVG